MNNHTYHQHFKAMQKLHGSDGRPRRYQSAHSFPATCVFAPGESWGLFSKGTPEQYSMRVIRTALFG